MNIPPLSTQLSRTLMRVVILAAGVFYAFFLWRNSFVVAGERFFSLFDDAMISMRYARNLAEGHGLRWNVGEPPVEGYTNFLWTIYLALWHLLPLATSKLCLPALLTGVVVLLANLVVVRKIAEELAPEDSVSPLLAVFFTAAAYPLIYWTLRGMEVGLLALLLNGALLLAWRLEGQWKPSWLAGLALLLAAALLTRPDAVVPAGLMVLWVLATTWRRGFRAAVLWLPLTLVAVAAGQTKFRLMYYGDALPNTYYLKVAGVSLLERVSRGMMVLGETSLVYLWPVLVLMVLALIFCRPAWPNLRAGSLYVLIGAQAAYSVYVGGDAWEWMEYSNRYLSIVLPLLFVVAARSLVLLAGVEPARLKWVAPLLGVGLFFHAALKFRKEHFAAAMLLLVGLALVACGFGIFPLLRRRGGLAALAGCAVIVGVSMNFFGLVSWVAWRNNGVLIKEDADQTRFGLNLKKATAPETLLAVTWAGAVPYFSERRCIDLLGKSDPIIAKGRPAAPFWPGHSKWNYAYSIGQLHPDFVISLWMASPEDEAMMVREGYRKIGEAYVRESAASRVNIPLITGAPR